MGVVDAPGDPFLHEETFQTGRVSALVDGGRLDDDLFAGFAIHGQISVAAAAGMDLPDDSVAVELHAGIQRRRKRQCGQLLVDLVGIPAGQRLDAENLDCQIVFAALRVGLVDDGFRGGIQVVRVFVDCIDDSRGRRVFINAVGRQYKDIALLDRQGLIIDFKLWIDPKRAAQVALFARHPETMVFGQLLQGIAAQPVDAGIAHMKQMRRGRLDDHAAEGADVAFVPVASGIGFAGSGHAARNWSHTARVARTA